MAIARTNMSPKAYFEAPANSYLRNPQISNLENISTPSLESTSFEGNLPSLDRKPSIPLNIPSVAPEKSGFSEYIFPRDEYFPNPNIPYVSPKSNTVPLQEVDLSDAWSTPTASTSRLTPSRPNIDPDATPRPSMSQLRNSEYEGPYRDPFASNFDPFD